MNFASLAVARAYLLPPVISIFAFAFPNTRANSTQELVVIASDFSFRAPDTVRAGLTKIRLKNEGPDFHHVQLVKLDAGHTVAELLARLSAHDVALPWVTYVGGPEGPAPGQESEATLELTPGQYAMICVVSSTDHVQHVAKGMIRALTVVASSRTGVAKSAEPKADVRLVLSDYAFTFTPALRSGRHTVRVENSAAQPHHVAIIRLNAGKTGADVEAWGKSRVGPRPFEPVGGTTMISQGIVNYFDADFVPGEYLLLCFARDVNDGKSHAEHGMVRQMRVL